VKVQTRVLSLHGTLTHTGRGDGTPPALAVYPHPATPNPNQKRGARRARQNKSPGSRGSITTLCGRQRLSAVQVSTTGTVTVSNNLTISALGDRPNAVSAAFLRYRYKWLKFTFRSAASTNGISLGTGALNTPAIGNLVMGVADDVALSTTSADNILNLRVSREMTTFKDSQITWAPLDRGRWFYVTADSVGDPRFTQPAIFLMTSDVPLQVATNGAGTPMSWNCGVIDLEYCIEFSGATVVPE